MHIPKFTFCIPNLNKILYLPACIESMLSQDCEDWRCVFVDGYSTDGSWEYMQQFSSDPRFTLMRGRQKGMYEDWNQCLEYVETEYFYFLTSDDTCYPTLVSTTTALLDAHPDIDVCHFQFAYINKEGSIIEPPLGLQSQFELYSNFNQMLHRRSGLCEFMMHFVYQAVYLTITSLVFRKCLIEKMDKFKTKFCSVGDYDWTMRLGLFTDVIYLPKLLATWRIYNEQATQKATRLQKQRSCLEIARLNLEFFIQENNKRHLCKSVNTKQILAYMTESHAASIVEKILHSQIVTEQAAYLYLLLNNYPGYPFKKILNRLSSNKLYPYSQRYEVAQELIQDYGLHWPPTLLEQPT
jgi:glycosyltransferase involved in cell wall biosynthesis